MHNIQVQDSAVTSAENLWSTTTVSPSKEKASESDLVLGKEEEEKRNAACLRYIFGFAKPGQNGSDMTHPPLLCTIAHDYVNIVLSNCQTTFVSTRPLVP